MNPAIAAVLTKATALGAKYGPKAVEAGKKAVMAGQKLGSYFTSPEAFKAGATQLGEQAVKAATSEGVQQAGKRALRDTLLYSAAEQVIPRALGQDAPDIRDTLVRQASGNVLAEGVTAGLKGRSFFGERGMKAGTARKIGEVTGQIGGQAFAQAVLPGEQANPFIPTDFGEGPKTTTGATKFTAEPESAQIVRSSTTDLSGIQASEALSERERYEYRLKLAQAEKMPSPVVHNASLACIPDRSVVDDLTI